MSQLLKPNHKIFRGWITEEINQKEIVFDGNYLGVLNQMLPYNSPLGKTNHSWFSFDHYRPTSVVDFGNLSATVDASVVPVIAGLQFRRKYERFFVTLSQSALVPGTSFFVDANFDKSQSTPIEILYGRDVSFDFSAVRQFYDTFTLAYSFGPGVVSQSDLFVLNVPQGFHDAFLIMQSNAIVQPADITLRVSDYILSSFRDVASENIPIGSQTKIAMAQNIYTNAFQVSLQAGGAGETGGLNVILTWRKAR